VNNRIFWKLLFGFALMIAATLVVVDFAVTRAWSGAMNAEIENTMRSRAQLFAQHAAECTQTPQQLVNETAQASGARATIIDRDGRVLADSEAAAASMENHSTRPEVLQALGGSLGVNRRQSRTVGVDFLYVAAPAGSHVVRLAYPLKLVAESTQKARSTMLIASLLAFVLAIVASAFGAWRTTDRLDRIMAFAGRVAEGDLTARLHESRNDEVGRLAQALDRTTQRLEDSFAELEQKRTELEAVLNSMQEAVVAVDGKGQLLWVNQRMTYLITGAVRIGAPVAQTLRDPNLIGALHEAAISGKGAQAHANNIAPGRSFQIAASPMADGGAVAVLFDVTEFEQLEKTRRDFIANVSHELRTPLTSVQGYAETLLEGADEKTQKEFLEIIRRNAARMTRLTEDLLALARVESGEKKPELAVLTPAEMLEEAAQHFREHQVDSGLELTIKSHALKPVNADSDAIHQVFSNLIDNACKYAADGKKLEIGSEDVEGFVRFYVRDFGEGIASEHLPRLFERFYRVDKARSRESGGTGLGLAIAKHVIRSHGGQIEASSELGHGSTFSFTLPEAKNS